MNYNMERLCATLKRDEGYNPKRHMVGDTEHIGIGFNLQVEWPDELLKYLNVKDEDDIEEINEKQADYILSYHIKEFANGVADKAGQQWDYLSGVRQEVLINIAFNVGLAGIRAFRKMWSAITDEDWEESAAQMLDSKAARQTGERYTRLANAFKNDDEKYFELDTLYDEIRNNQTDVHFDCWANCLKYMESHSNDDLFQGINNALNELKKRLPD